MYNSGTIATFWIPILPSMTPGIEEGRALKTMKIHRETPGVFVYYSACAT